MVIFVIILVLAVSYVGGELLPISPYVFIGEHLVLNCTIPESDEFRDLNISSAYFTKGNQHLPKDNIQISDDTALYNTTVSSTNDEGRYGCWLETPEDILLGSQIVNVDYAPVAITNFTCIVYDWTDGLKCDWSLGVDYVWKEYIKVDFWWSIPGGEYQQCPHLTNTSCTWTSSEYRGSSQMFIYITVKNTKRDVTASFQENLRTSQHVQPSAPTDLVVVGNVGKTCVTLNWGHEKSRPKLFSVIYESRNKTMIEKEIVGSRNLTMSICDLNPYTGYKFIVKCKPKDNGYWSANRTIQATTLQDVPLSGPVVSSGSFKLTRCIKTKRNVALYWGDVAEDEQQGEIIEYMILTPSENFTVYSDVHTLEIPDEPCHQTQNYFIYSKTNIGYSKDYSQIVIPQHTMVPVDNFTIQMVIVNNTERIIGTWLPVKSLTEITNITYTVYWCWYDPTHPLCQGSSLGDHKQPYQVSSKSVKNCAL
ncbi:hypothetical protein LOTGIDRAFT_157412 [Lottia gigantea]|uniref:Fibronectin type-III domain-containing protein n=1 Tax=Lottia gigantea TaxID=225164 RepID=V4AB63_LOTGI|nr:hypothetical protein LOTGIDRAFT_157412 [Lottia gigantea]ESP01239.1 hypothetical protein LOTGIDRAFT_157412 [Lottia gigantea]